MDDKQGFDVESAKAYLEELHKKLPPPELEEFSIELHLAMSIFFEGEVERSGRKITLTTPSGRKFRVTTELITEDE